MNILIVDNTSSSTCHFRLPLLKDLINQGNFVLVLAMDGDFQHEIESTGASFKVVSGSPNGSISPRKDLLYAKQLRACLIAKRFDCVLTFQLKPNIFGCLEAKKVRIPVIIATVEGLGRPFSEKGLLWYFIREVTTFLQRRAYKNINRVFLLNQESKQIFLKKRIALQEQIRVLPGIGVDKGKFSYKPLHDSGFILMASRLLAAKGVFIFCEAAKQYHLLFPDEKIPFVLDGPEGDIKKADLLPYIEAGDIMYKGCVYDMRDEYEGCLCFVLPSRYFEGVPMSILEAMSVGRAIITTQNPGCNQTIQDGVNGRLLLTNSPLELAKIIHEIVSDRPKLEFYGAESRKMVDKWFSSDIVDSIFLEEIGRVKNEKFR